MTDKNKPISSSNLPESRGTRTEKERKEIKLEQEPVIESVPAPKSKSQAKKPKIQSGKDLKDGEDT